MSDYKVCDLCDHPALDWRRCDSCEDVILPCECDLGTTYYISGQDMTDKPKGILCLKCYEDAKASQREMEP